MNKFNKNIPYNNQPLLPPNAKAGDVGCEILKGGGGGNDFISNIFLNLNYKFG